MNHGRALWFTMNHICGLLSDEGEENWDVVASFPAGPRSGRQHSPRSGRQHSPRSGRQHKAWGASPRIRIKKFLRAREAGGSAWAIGCRPLRGLVRFFDYAILGLTPQALCWRPLRGLGTFPLRGLGTVPLCRLCWTIAVDSNSKLLQFAIERGTRVMKNLGAEFDVAASTR